MNLKQYLQLSSLTKECWFHFKITFLMVWESISAIFSPKVLQVVRLSIVNVLWGIPCSKILITKMLCKIHNSTLLQKKLEKLRRYVQDPFILLHSQSCTVSVNSCKHYGASNFWRMLKILVWSSMIFESCLKFWANLSYQSHKNGFGGYSKSLACQWTSIFIDIIIYIIHRFKPIDNRHHKECIVCYTLCFHTHCAQIQRVNKKI